MKIAFLCGSLEPGRDGVGDYTRRLSGEVIRQGNETVVIALNDPYVKEVVAGEQSSDGINFPVLRMPSSWSMARRAILTKEWIEKFDSQWISLQYVPFAFQSKGIHFGLNKALKSIAPKKCWHFMFHELWVGKDSHFDLKRHLTGFVQKVLIKQLVAAIGPQIIHTHLPANLSRLEKFGWEVKSLPLFSNIEFSNQKWKKSNNKVFRIVFFSQIDINDSIVLFLKKIKRQTILCGLEIDVVLICRNDVKANAVKESIERIDGFQNRVSIMGFLEFEKVSSVLQTSSLGITPIPRHALGKSGSVAAFLAHGIPVAAPNVHFKHNASEVGFFSAEQRSSILMNPDLAELKIASENAKVVKDKVHVSFVAKTFISDLEGCLYE